MKPITSASLSVEQLKRALEVRQQIETLEQELSSILTNTPITTVAASPSFLAGQTTPAPKGKRVMSVAWRAKLAAAQKRRWAKARAEKASMLTPVKPLVQAIEKKATSGRKAMSPEARAKIGAAVKARHAAKARANKKS